MSETKNLLERLQSFPKTYFSFNDILKFYPGKENVLKVLLSRLVEQKRIIRLTKGYYSLNLSDVNFDALACQMLRPSYISFEYALWRYGLINEIPARITLATTKKTRVYTLYNNTFEYSHLNQKLFFGYAIDGEILIAKKEKALLDEIYLISLKRRSLNLRKIDFSMLEKNILLKWMKNYPLFTQRIVKNLIK